MTQTHGKIYIMLGINEYLVEASRKEIIQKYAGLVELVANIGQPED